MLNSKQDILLIWLPSTSSYDSNVKENHMVYAHMNDKVTPIIIRSGQSLHKKQTSLYPDVCRIPGCESQFAWTICGKHHAEHSLQLLTSLLCCYCKSPSSVYVTRMGSSQWENNSNNPLRTMLLGFRKTRFWQYSVLKVSSRTSNLQPMHSCTGRTSTSVSPSFNHKQTIQ